MVKYATPTHGKSLTTTIDLSLIKPRVYEYEWLEKGDLFKVDGEDGAFKFLGAALNPEAEVLWIDAIGPIGNDTEQLRSIRPEKVLQPSDQTARKWRKLGLADR